ncbi:MAG: PilN domain-containing protein [Vicinamibacterales bacterium]
MIRINLLGGERQKKTRAVAFDLGRQLTLACTLILVLTVAALGWWYWSLGQESAQVDADLATAQQEVARLQSVLNEVQQAEQRQQQVQQRVALIEQLQRGQNTPVQLLDHVSRSLPDMLWLTEMSQVNDQVTIQGQSTTLISVSDFVGNLGTSPLLLKPIEIVSSQVEPATLAGASANAGSVDVIRFTVQARIAPPPGTVAPATASPGATP